MENGLISDAQLSASSRWNDFEGADRGRLHLTEVWDPHLRSGAWIAKTNDINQWLQIDVLGLNRKYVRVTRVATQGRDSTAYGGVQCVKTYKLQYSNDGVNFQYYKENGQTTAKVIIYRWGRGGGYFLIFALEVCAAPKGLVFAPSGSENGYRLCLVWSGLNSGMVFEGIRECLNVFVVSIPN